MRQARFFDGSKNKLLALFFTAGIWVALPIASDAQPLSGFQTNRYEPTAPGDWGFLVDHPWFSKIRYFAADLTLDYANRGLVFGDTNRLPFVDPPGTIALQHQIFGHLGLAVSFLDRVRIDVSWPVTFWEQGTSVDGIDPLSSVGFGDPRFGLTIRIAGQPYEDAISLSIAGNCFIPLRAWTDSIAQQVGDQEVRAIGKLILAGVLRNEDSLGKKSKHGFVWSIISDFYYRKESVLGTAPNTVNNSTGNQFQLGVNFGYGYFGEVEHFHLGLEALLSTDVRPENAFQVGSMDLTLLLGLNIPFGRFVNFNVAGGVGLLHQSATADARFLAQLVFAPWPKAKNEIPKAQPTATLSPIAAPPKEVVVPPPPPVAPPVPPPPPVAATPAVVAPPPPPPPPVIIVQPPAAPIAPPPAPPVAVAPVVVVPPPAPPPPAVSAPVAEEKTPKKPRKKKSRQKKGKGSPSST